MVPPTPRVLCWRRLVLRPNSQTLPFVSVSVSRLVYVPLCILCRFENRSNNFLHLSFTWSTPNLSLKKYLKRNVFSSWSKMAKRSPPSSLMTVVWIISRRTMKSWSLVSVAPVTPSVIFPAFVSRLSRSPMFPSWPCSMAKKRDHDHKWTK